MSAVGWSPLMLSGLLAYVLPSGVLLHQMAVERSAQLPASFEVTGTLTLTGEEGRKLAASLGLPATDEPQPVPAELGFGPGRCTLTVRAPQRAAITNDRGALSPVGSGPAVWLVRLGCLPFLFRGEGGEAAFETLLRKSGGRFEDPGLTLAEGEVAYVLGAGEDGSGKVGLVVKKRGLQPLRTWEDESGIRVSVDFRGYRQIFREGGFPTVIELRTGGALVATFVATP